MRRRGGPSGSRRPIARRAPGRTDGPSARRDFGVHLPETTAGFRREVPRPAPARLHARLMGRPCAGGLTGGGADQDPRPSQRGWAGMHRGSGLGSARGARAAGASGRARMTRDAARRSGTVTRASRRTGRPRGGGEEAGRLDDRARPAGPGRYAGEAPCCRGRACCPSPSSRRPSRGSARSRRAAEGGLGGAPAEDLRDDSWRSGRPGAPGGDPRADRCASHRRPPGACRSRWSRHTGSSRTARRRGRRPAPR